MIKPLNLLFEPLSYGEQPEPGEEDMAEEDTNSIIGDKAIYRKKRGRKTYYLFRGGRPGFPGDSHEQTMLMLGMYPQLRGGIIG